MPKHRFKAVAVRFPVMNYHGQVKLLCQRQLGVKIPRLQLAVKRLPVIVEPYLSQCDDFVLPSFRKQFSQSLKLCLDVS